MDPCNAPPASKRTRLNPSFQCNTCGSSYTERRTLLRHQRAAHGGPAGFAGTTSYPCSQCQKSYRRADTLSRHVKEVHNKVPRPLPTAHEDDDSPGTLAEPENDGSFFDFDTEAPGMERDRTDTSSFNLNHPALQPRDTSFLPGLDQALPTITEYEEAHSLGDVMSIRSTKSSKTSNEYAGNDSGIDMSEEPRTGCQQADSNGQAAIDALVAKTADLTLTARQLNRRGVTRRPKVTIPRCLICGKPFGGSIQEIRAHIAEHITDLSSTAEHRCLHCDISFLYADDLEHHLQSAESGHCGFSFNHMYACTGHHPLSQDDVLRDDDPDGFAQRVFHWQQARLQAFRLQIGRLAAETFSFRTSDGWSVGGDHINFRNSLSTDQSSFVCHSAPDTGRGQRRVRLYGRDRLRKILGRTERMSHPNLVEAALKGDIQGVKEFLDRGVDVDSKEYVQFGVVDFKEFELREGSINALAAAILHKHHNVCTLLLKCGSGANSIVYLFEAAFSMLHLAVGTGNTAIIEQLLHAGAVPDGPVSCRSNQLLDIFRGNGSNAASLLMKHGPTSSLDEQQLTHGKPTLWPHEPPLFYAIRKGSRDVVQLLLAHGADMDDATSIYTPVLWAALHGQPEIVHLLLTHGAAVHRDSPDSTGSAVLKCAQEGWEGALEVLHTCGVDIDFLSTSCKTFPPSDDNFCSNALIAAIQKQQYAAAELLLKAGASSTISCKSHAMCHHDDCHLREDISSRHLWPVEIWQLRYKVKCSRCAFEILKDRHHETMVSVDSPLIWPR